MRKTFNYSLLSTTFVVLALISSSLPAADSNNDADTDAQTTGKIENLLIGRWRGVQPCVGNLFVEADGNYRQTNVGPGGVKFSGTWKLRTDVHPPILELQITKGPQKDRKELYRLTEITDEQLNLKYDDKTSCDYKRMHKKKDRREN